ncbi:hypothetical protein GY45DRAFT_1363980 [Cubamyces sp. BRFM 1775]|nr:hypothetical protein GY45DRAFT_1363980 [Cubamyces sp. BRFM 1775]
MAPPNNRGNMLKKDLEIMVTRLEESLNEGREERDRLQADLQSARDTIQELEAAMATAATTHEEAMAAALAAAERAEQAAATAAARATAERAHAQANAADAEREAAAPPIPKPSGAMRGLEALSGLSRQDYMAVQRTIRNLVVIANLDWKEDFRRQNAESLARLYRAARDQHPILKRFQNSWLTAALAKQFLQNKRKHAVKNGYIDRDSLKTARRGN